MLVIRQGATHKVVIGPAVAVGDGFTPVTTLAVSSADEAEAILHDNGTVVDISGYTFAAITTADGYYHLTLQSGISGTVGHMTVVINDDSLILPLRQDFTVLEEAVYDALYAGSAVGPLLANSNGSGLTEAGGTGDQLTALATQASVDTIDNFLDTEIAAILEDTGTTLDGKINTIDTVVDAIKVQTDKFVFTVANQVDSNVQSINDAALGGDGSSGDPWGPA